jgi:hypothetical protein
MEEIDLEEIYESTQVDYEAGRYCCNSEDYAMDEEASLALLTLYAQLAKG